MVLPGKVHLDRTSHTTPPLGSFPARVKDAGGLGRGIFSVKVEFHTFSEMIFQFLPCFFFFFPLQLFLVLLNRIEHEL